MRSQFFENDDAGQGDSGGFYPEAEVRIAEFPEPAMIDEAFSIAGNDVVHRVQLEDPPVCFRYHLETPEDWCAPEAELDEHGDELADVFEEDDEG